MSTQDHAKDSINQSHATQLVLKLFEVAKESVERLVDDLPITYCVVDRSGKIIRGNNNLGKLLQVPFEQLRGQSLQLLFSPQEWQRALKAMEIAHTNHGKHELLLPTSHGGSEKFYVWNFSSLADATKEQLFTVVGQDVTEAELGLRKVKKLNDLLDRLIKASQEMIASDGVDGAMNIALSTLLGALPENLVQQLSATYFLDNREEALQATHSRSTGSAAPKKLSTTLNIDWKNKTVGHLNFDCAEIKDPELVKFIQLMGQSAYLTLSHLSFQKEMEDKVLQGTKEISQLNQGLSTLLNSLEEGYAVFNLQGVFEPTFSRKMREFCDQDLSGKEVCSVFELSTEETKQFGDWLHLIAKEALSFEDMAGLCPATWLYPDKKERSVSLTYHAIRNEQDKVEKIAVVATDRTSELAAQKKASEESERSFMVLRILEDIIGFEDCWSSINDFVNEFSVRVNDREQCKRTAHTLKSSFSYFGWDELSKLLNDFESDYSQNGLVDLPKWNVRFKSKIEDFKERFPQIFRYMNIARIQGSSVAADDQIIELLKSSTNLEDLRTKIMNQWLHQPLANLLEPYFKRLEARAANSGVKIKIETHGLDARIYAQPYRNFFVSLEHLFNNIIDHGFANTNSKEFLGLITISAHQTETGLLLKVQDNGAGIDSAKLLKKAKTSGIKLTPDLEKNPLNLIFVQGLSTADGTSMRAGRGVGMEVVAHEIKLLGGTITVQSQLGAGTSFEIALPKHQIKFN